MAFSGVRLALGQDCVMFRVQMSQRFSSAVSCKLHTVVGTMHTVSRYLHANLVVFINVVLPSIDRQKHLVSLSSSPILLLARLSNLLEGCI